MSFRPSTDLNPNITIQNAQTDHLYSSNKLLPNTVKDGSGFYYSPLLDSDGKLIVVSSGTADINHGTEIATLVDNISYSAGTHQSNSADVSASTGLMTLQGTISGSPTAQSIVIRGSHDNSNFFELHNVAVNLVDIGSGTTQEFLVNFQCAMKFIQIQYYNGDAIPRTVNAKLSFKT